MPLTKITAAPATLQYTYHYQEDWSGLNLSGKDLRDSDWIECISNSVNLTGAKLDNLYSRRTTWAGSTFPPDIPYLSHDMVSEAIRQRVGTLKVAERPIATEIMDRVAASYWNSWDDSTKLTLRFAKAANIWRKIFAPWPPLLERFEDSLTRMATGTPSVLGQPFVVQREDGVTLTLTVPVTARPEDREDARAQLEARISAFMGAPYSVFVVQLTPFLACKWRPLSPKRDWWRSD